MSFSSISRSRPILSYSKVQLAMAYLTRGKTVFIKRNNFKDKILLNVGCGPFPKDNFINLDYEWRPGLDICWDITKKAYPLTNEKVEGIFTEHCLEHIPYEKCIENLKEFYRLLKPGGTLRIVVPDGEIYCDLYQRRKTDKTVTFPYVTVDEAPMVSINRIFRGHGHLFIYDFEVFRRILGEAGFRNIKKEAFRQGRDERLLIDRKEREVESLYVEATK